MAEALELPPGTASGAVDTADGPGRVGEIGVLARRRIQAEVIKPIYEVMKREIGEQRAQAIIEEAISADAVREGRAYAAREAGGADIKSFVRLQHLWEKDNALEVEILAADEQRYDYNVKRCRYAEMYHEMGIGEIGHVLSCNRDAEFIVGYDSRVALERTSTIMRGGACCDFRYRVKQAETGPHRDTVSSDSAD